MRSVCAQTKHALYTERMKPRVSMFQAGPTPTTRDVGETYTQLESYRTDPTVPATIMFVDSLMGKPSVGDKRTGTSGEFHWVWLTHSES